MAGNKFPKGASNVERHVFGRRVDKAGRQEAKEDRKASRDDERALKALIRTRDRRYAPGSAQYDLATKNIEDFARRKGL